MAETVIAAPPAGARSSLRRKRLVSLTATAALALGSVIALPAVANAAETPSFTVDVTEIADERIDIAIEGTGYGDVAALPGQSEPHAYFTVVERGSDLAGVGQADTAISATVAADGTVSDVLSIPADELDAATEYEVISWPSRSFPTEANLYARVNLTIDWSALFPVEEPTWNPQLTVAPAAELNAEGDTVTVTGTGYKPAQGLYVFLCEDVDLPADLWQLALSCRSGAALATPDADGAFELEFSVRQLNDAPTAVYTAANHTAMADRTQDAKASLAFAAPVEPQPAVPTFTAAVTEIENERIDVVIRGGGYDDVAALPGQTEPHVYFTLVERGADLSGVTQGDTAISAAVAADGTITAVLSVPAAELDATVSYEVISWPSRSFPTDANIYARADIMIDWTALFPAEEPVEPQPEEPGDADDDDSDNGSTGGDTGSTDDDTPTTGGSSTTGSTTASTTATKGDTLATTGVDGAGIALSAAALLMLVGAGVVVRARRRTAVTDEV